MKRSKIDEYLWLVEARRKALQTAAMIQAGGVFQIHHSPLEARVELKGAFQDFEPWFCAELHKWAQENQSLVVGNILARMDAAIAKAAEEAKAEALALLAEVEAASKPTGGAQ